MTNCIYTTFTKRNNVTEAILKRHSSHFNEIANSKKVTDVLLTIRDKFETFNLFVDFVQRYMDGQFSFTFKRKAYYFNELPAQIKANIRYFVKASA